MKGAMEGKRMLVAFALAAVLLAGLSWSGCVTYTGISREGNDIYFVGSTSFLIFGENWVKKCAERFMPSGRAGLTCHEMTVGHDGSGLQAHEPPSEVSEPKALARQATWKRSPIAHSGMAQPEEKEDAAYWKTKCNSVNITLKDVASASERKKLLRTCQRKCRAGSSMALQSCVRDAKSEEEYRKCGELL